MISTDDSDLAKRAKHITTTAKQPHPFEFIHDEIGYNFRLPNINAALGVAQMKKLDSYARREIEKLAEQTKSERKARIETARKQGKEFDDLSNRIEGWFSELEEQLEGESQEYRSALQAQSDEINIAIQDTYDQLSASLASEARSLEESKIDREDLANAFQEMAKVIKKGPKGRNT